MRGEKTGGIEDDRAAFLKRIAEKEYLVHDLDNVKIETYGRAAAAGRQRRAWARPRVKAWRSQKAWCSSVFPTRG